MENIILGLFGPVISPYRVSGSFTVLDLVYYELKRFRIKIIFMIQSKYGHTQMIINSALYWLNVIFIVYMFSYF